MNAQGSASGYNKENVKYLNTIFDFFTFGTLQQQLQALNNWLNRTDSGEGGISIPDLLYRYKHFAELYAGTFRFLEYGRPFPPVTAAGLLEQERLAFDFYPELPRDLIADPVMALRQLFEIHGDDFYQEQLFEWLTDTVSEGSMLPGNVPVEILLNATRQLVSACWLIHIRYNLADKAVGEQAVSVDMLMDFVRRNYAEPVIFREYPAKDAPRLLILVEDRVPAAASGVKKDAEAEWF